MDASRRAKPAGFTLIELMLGVVILGVLVSVGMPSFQKMIRNAEIRSAAEAVSGGIMRARAEAVSHNAKVQFTLETGTSWYVDYVSTPNPSARLDSRPSSDSLNASLTVLPVGATTITFNQLGQMVANADASASLTQVTFTATGGDQTLKVKIGVGGNARVCDDSLPSTNFRSCLYG
jgi:type IV fimbrial biogenesis protein FimT